jgi:nucleoside-diphosphate-sugar epimerase
MEKKILICGKNSLLFKIFKTYQLYNYDTVSHNEISKINLDHYKLIILFSFDESLHKKKIDIDNSFENYLIDKIKDRNIHLIYFSTSRVYENSNKEKLNEELPINLSSLTMYSFNKKIIEDFFLRNLNQKCTILRLSNILHSREFCINKRTFMCTFYKNLKNNFIQMPSNNFKKDFIDQNSFNFALSNIIEKYDDFIGIFNFGSGCFISKNDFINSANNFGVHKLIDGDETFSFILDITKLNQKLNLNISNKKLIQYLNKYVNSVN